jgi:DNA-binding HxlR family transcriptional regulator
LRLKKLSLKSCNLISEIMIKINQLNKEFESRVRLGIMSVLMVNDWVDFSEMKSLLEITDGNLASHSNALEKAAYIEVKKEFVGKKPKTSYRVTQNGRQAFTEHLDALEKLIGR